MRTLEEIKNEYATVCAQLGDFEVKRAQFLSQVLAKVAELDVEAGKVKELQAELDKQKAEAEAAKAAEAPAAVSEEPVAQ